MRNNKHTKNSIDSKYVVLFFIILCCCLIKNLSAQVQLSPPHFVPLHCDNHQSGISLSMSVTSDGSHYVVKLTDTSKAILLGNNYILGVPVIEKYDVNFNLIWRKSYPCDINKSVLSTLWEVSPSSFIVRGSVLCKNAYGSFNPDTTSSVYQQILLKLDTAGNITKSLILAGSTTVETGLSNQDKIYFGSATGGPPELPVTINLGSGILCFDTNLNKRWTVVFNNYNSGIYSWPLYDIKVMPNGHLLGITNARPIDTTFYGRTPDSLSTTIIFEFDSTGKIFWMKRYGCGAVAALGGSPRLQKIFKDKYDPYYYIIGKVGCTSGSCYDTAFPSATMFSREKTWIIKLDTLGNILWNRVIGVPLDINATNRFAYINSAQKINTLEVMNYMVGSDSCAGDSLGKFDYWNYTIDSTGAMVQSWRYTPAIGKSGFEVSNMQYNSSLGKMIYSIHHTSTNNYPNYSFRGNCDTTDGIRSDFYGYFDWYPAELPQQNLQSDIPLIYPNPSNGTLIVESPQWPGNVFVYNMQGQLMSTFKLESAKQTIQLGNLPKANYLVRVVAKTLSYAVQVQIE
jgi:Secretion system C-terminal sorting domain